MALTKIDSISLGRGSLVASTESVAIFTSNVPVSFWGVGTSYSQFNVVEHSGGVWRSKVNSNLGNNPLSSPNQWEKIYGGTKDGDFAFITGTGATIMQRQLGAWLVFGNHPAREDIYDEPMTVVVGAPADDNEITGPVTVGTLVSLPLDSRQANSIEYYIVGASDLEVRLNGNKLYAGDDYLEVGAPASQSSIINIQAQLEIGDRVVFRRVSLVNITGYGGGGGGGGGSLQDAYNVGASITVATGVPFTVSGVSGKIAQFNGDITVTGFIDPKGISFSREASSPVPSGQDGIWVNSLGELNYHQDGGSPINISSALSGSLSSEATCVVLTSNIGSTLFPGTPVCLNTSGEIKLIDVSQEADADSVVGIVFDVITNGASGRVLTNGKLANISTFIAKGSAVYVSKAGILTSTKPSIGLDGFVAGDWIIKLGVISANISNPANKDIILNPTTRGQL